MVSHCQRHGLSAGCVVSVYERPSSLIDLASFTVFDSVFASTLLPKDIVSVGKMDTTTYYCGLNLEFISIAGRQIGARQV